MSEYWTALLQIAGLLTVGGASTIGIIVLSIVLQARWLLWVALCVGAATVVYGFGVSHEKVLCDAREKAAIAKFEALQEKVRVLVEQYANKTEAELSKEELEIAERLKAVLERQAKAATAVCTATDLDAADDLSLRRRPQPVPAAGKRGGKAKGQAYGRL